MLLCIVRWCKAAGCQYTWKHADVGHARMETQRSWRFQGIIWQEREKVDSRTATESANLQTKRWTCEGILCGFFPDKFLSTDVICRIKHCVIRIYGIQFHMITYIKQISIVHVVVTSVVLGTCVSDLPRAAVWQCGGWKSNSQPIDRYFSTLTAMLLSHFKQICNFGIWNIPSQPYGEC